MKQIEGEGTELVAMSDPRAAWPDPVSNKLTDLAKRCTDMDSHRRPYIKEVAIEMSGMNVQIGVALFYTCCRFYRN